MKEAILCYEIYQEMVEKTGVIDIIGDKIHFETHNPLLGKITEALIP